MELHNGSDASNNNWAGFHSDLNLSGASMPGSERVARSAGLSHETFRNRTEKSQDISLSNNLFSELVGTSANPGEFSFFCRDRDKMALRDLDPAGVRSVLSYREAVEQRIRDRFRYYYPEESKKGFLVFHHDTDLMDTFVTVGPNRKPTHATFLSDIRYRLVDESRAFSDKTVVTNKEANVFLLSNIDACTMIEGPLWDEKLFKLSPIYGDNIHPRALELLALELQQTERVPALAQLCDEAWNTASKMLGFKQASTATIRKELTTVNAADKEIVSQIRDQSFRVKYHRARKEEGALVKIVCSVVEPSSGRTLGQSVSPLAYFVARNRHH